MIPKEFSKLIRGQNKREDDKWFMLAWQTAYLMNATGNMKRPVTVDRLLGRDPSVKMTEVDKRKELESIKKQFRDIAKRKEQQAKNAGY
jgi:hypothetical protein